MANQYFSFKEFTVWQQHTPMKVCTDACILAGWVANSILKDEVHILDIGTGTGLLSLMLAQKSNAIITAIEQDENAFRQASENFKESKWNDRLTLVHTRLQEFQDSRAYDFIICNPPFYEGDLRSPDSSRNAAMHDSTLTLEELLYHGKRLLKPDGRFCIMVPYSRGKYLSGKAVENGFHISDVLHVRHSPAHSFFRTIILLTTNFSETREHRLTIKDENEYTKEFRHLLADYYRDL